MRLNTQHARGLLLTALMLLTAGIPLASAASGPDTLTVCADGCDHTSIQAAVDAAGEDDTIEIGPGTYNERIQITADRGSAEGLTLHGAGQNVTVLDGTDINRDAIKITVDDVTIRDLTVQNYGGNGIFYDGVTGFHVTDVSAIRNGPYGIYAIRSEAGIFEDSFASEHADSGFYLGETDACECLIRNVVAVDNLIGYSGTGAAHILIEDSVWRRNAAGIVPNVLPQEPVPQTNLIIKDNLVENNNNQSATDRWTFSGGIHVPSGLGIVLAGGIDDLVTKNVVRDHHRGGIVVAFLFTEPSLNRIIDNTVADNGVDILWDGGGVNNCFEENTHPDGSPATFNAGTVWNTVETLPDCDTPNAGAPDPILMERLVTLLVFDCEPDEFHANPTNILDDAEPCDEHATGL